MSFTFDIHTLGCVKNEADSDMMADALIRAGFQKNTKSPDVLLINTCSFLQVATEESIDAILAASDTYGSSWKGKIIVCGCLPSRFPQDLAQELPEVSAFVSCDNEKDIVHIVSNLLGCSVKQQKELCRTHSRYLTYAFVKISDGCNRKCSFCAIPLIRGSLVSRKVDELKKEIRALAQNGIKEVVLVAQDTAAYGRDFDSSFKGPRTLNELLRELDVLAEKLGIWLRVLYIQPDELTRQLIETFASARAILPYFDIPLQHTNDSILQSMGRRTRFETFLKQVDYIKKLIPDATIRSTALVGYPGETNEMFEMFLKDIQSAPLDYLAVFQYSREEGTKAAEFDNQISEEIKQSRFRQMFDVSQDLGFASVKERVERVYPVIIDGFDQDENAFYGHASFQTPETDGVIYVSDRDVTPGEIVDVHLDEAACYDVFGHITQKGRS